MAMGTGQAGFRRKHLYAAKANAHFSSSSSIEGSKLSSQPISTRILMPPSSSSNDCDAGEADCAPRSDVNSNIGTLTAVESTTGSLTCLTQAGTEQVSKS
jgi:hypothetical protein